MNVLVTGGAGYIGSHTCVELLNRGYGVVVIDNLVNSNPKAIERVEAITGKKVAFYENDVRDRAALDRIFEKHDISCAIHFAGLKAVGESVAMPLEYYDNNLYSTIRLCEAMAAGILRQQPVFHNPPLRGHARSRRARHCVLLLRHGLLRR